MTAELLAGSLLLTNASLKWSGCFECREVRIAEWKVGRVELSVGRSTDHHLHSILYVCTSILYLHTQLT